MKDNRLISEEDIAVFELPLDNLDLKQIAESGQCFRWVEGEDKAVSFLVGKCAVNAKQSGNKVMISAYEKSKSAEQIKTDIMEYLDIYTDYAQIIASIDANDEHLTQAAGLSKGIRILKQPLWEVMISFMISQNNNIPRIKNSVEKLTVRFGHKIIVPFKEWPQKLEYTFPSANEIDTDNLGELGLGYREEYIRELVNKVNDGSILLSDFLENSINDMNTEDDCLELTSKNKDKSDKSDVNHNKDIIERRKQVHKDLKKIKGVGDKVAACIELYGLHDLGAFPVDTWVKKIEEKYYNKHFPIDNYPVTAGVMQQYLFFAERLAENKLN